MRHTAEQIQTTINEWQVSGLSKKEFCRQRDICHQTFYNWLKRSNHKQSSGFLEVALPQTEPTYGCEIVFPSGARMILQGEPSTSWLRELIR